VTAFAAIAASRSSVLQLHDRHREVAVVQLDQLAVAEVLLVPQVGEVVLVPAGALQLARVAQQQPGLTEGVQGDVRQRDVLLQLRRAGRPLGEPLRGDQAVVGQRQHVVGPHRCSTPSGTG
jgi:hypothetical protein